MKVVINSTYLRDLVAVFKPMRLAMTMADRAVRYLLERSISSTGSSPLSCLIGSRWPSRLCTRVEKAGGRCQRVLTIMKAVISGGGAYRSSTRLWLDASALAKCLAASASRELPLKLRSRDKQRCHGLLTIMKAVISGGDAHFSTARVPFCLSASASAVTPERSLTNLPRSK